MITQVDEDPRIRNIEKMYKTKKKTYALYEET